LLVDDRGFWYVEVLFAIFFVSAFLLMALAHFEQVLLQGKWIQEKGDVYWAVKNEIELWKKDIPMRENDGLFPYRVQVKETWLSPNIKEGDFTVTWTEENSLKTMTITAYKLVSP